MIHKPAVQKTENSPSLKQRLPPQFEEMVVTSVPGGRMKERSSNKEDRLQVCVRSSLTLSSWVTGRSFCKEDKTAGIWTRRHQAKSKGVMSHSKQGFSQSMHPENKQTKWSMHPGAWQAQRFRPLSFCSAGSQALTLQTRGQKSPVCVIWPAQTSPEERTVCTDTWASHTSSPVRWPCSQASRPPVLLPCPVLATSLWVTHTEMWSYHHWLKRTKEELWASRVTLEWKLVTVHKTF